MAHQRLLTLTTLRFVAAAGFVFYHLMPAWPGLGYPTWPTPVSRLFNVAMLGLPLFYALSGFVLYYTYRAEPPVTAPERKRFWRRRFARIAPVFYVSLVLTAPFVFTKWIAELGPAEGAGKAALALLANFAFLSAWFPSSLAFNFPTWSVAVEMFFYLCFPFALPLVARLSQRGAGLALVGCFLAGGIMQGLGAAFVPALLRWPNEGPLAFPALSNFLQLHPLVHLPEFLFGLALARWWELKPPVSSGQADAALLTGLVLPALVLGSGVPVPYLMLASFLGLPLIALLLWGGAGPRGASLRVLERPGCVALGEASYAIYVLHMPLGQAFLALWPRASMPAVHFATFVGLLFALSIGVQRYFEFPLRAWINGGPSRSER